MLDKCRPACIVLHFFSDIFTEEELMLFNKRYENGYDLRTDSRYNLWLQIAHDQGLLKKCCVSSPSTFKQKQFCGE